MAFNLFDFPNKNQQLLNPASALYKTPKKQPAIVPYTAQTTVRPKPVQQPITLPSEQTPQPNGFVQSVGKVLFAPFVNAMTNAPEEGEQYRTLKPELKGLEQSPEELLGNIAKGSQNIASKIENAGYDQNALLGRKVKEKFPGAYDHIDDAELGKKTLEKYPQYQKILDEQGSVLEHPITGTLASIAAAPFKAAAGLAQGESTIARGGSQLATGDTGTALSNIAKGAVGSTMGAIGLATGFTPAGATINTAFSSNTGGNLMKNVVSDPLERATADAQAHLGLNPESEASKNIQQTVGQVAPLVALHGAQEYGAPLLNKAFKTGAEKLPSVTEAIQSAKELQGKVSEVPGKLGEGVKNLGNKTAESMLSSQWKLDKATRRNLSNNIGETGPKFALERDLVGKDIETTMDNAQAYKIQKIQEKLNAVKGFGETQTPDVAKNIATVLQNDLINAVKKSYGKDADVASVLKQNHPDLSAVYKLTQEINSSPTTDYVKLEQLKELHDYLNPEGIQYDLQGRPVSEVGNLLASGKRQQLQQILEKAGQQNGVDIKGINKEIQGAYSLQKGLENTVGRRSNLNMLGLGDTQAAVIASILGGAPGALGGVLLKKGLTSEGFVGGMAKKLYSKTGTNETINPTDNGVNNSTPKSRLNRIMDNSTSTPVTKTIKKK